MATLFWVLSLIAVTVAILKAPVAKIAQLIKDGAEAPFDIGQVRALNFIHVTQGSQLI
jgi:hypothetical protein